MRSLHKEATDQRHTNIGMEYAHIRIADKINVVLFHDSFELVSDILSLLQGPNVEKVLARPSSIGAI
jgi:hypothetical protein